MGNKSLLLDVCIRLKLISFIFILSFVFPLSAETKALRIVVESRPPAYGNPYTQAMPSIFHPLFPIFDALTYLGDSGEVLPKLALRYEMVDDFTWRFFLRQDVFFSNGEAFDAFSYKANLDYLFSDSGKTTYAASLVPTIQRVEVESQHVLLIYTNSRDPILARRLSAVVAVPPIAWREYGGAGFGVSPVGSGPYKVVDWGDTDGIMKYEAYKDSWQGAPRIDQVKLLIQSDGAARSQALISGQADVAMNLDIDEFDYLRSKDMMVHTFTTPVVGSLAFSNQDPLSPFSDLRVRLAFNYAVDREAIARFIYRGLVSPTGQGTIEGVYGHNPTIKSFSYDPDRARALLSDAGYGDGLKVGVRVSPGSPANNMMYQKVAQDLNAVGVDLDIQFVQGPRWLRMWFSGNWGEADLISSAWSNTTFMDAARGLETYSCLRANAFFCDKKVADILGLAAKEMNSDRRLEFLHQAALEMHNSATVLYLFPQIQNLILSKSVKGIAKVGNRVKMENLYLP